MLDADRQRITGSYHSYPQSSGDAKQIGKDEKKRLADAKAKPRGK